MGGISSYFSYNQQQINEEEQAKGLPEYTIKLQDDLSIEVTRPQIEVTKPQIEVQNEPIERKYKAHMSRKARRELRKRLEYESKKVRSTSI